MFMLLEVKDSIRVLPSKFNVPLSVSVATEITNRYANRVIPHQGLVVTLHDLLELGDPLIRPGDPSAHLTARFRLLLFRPLPGQVILGTVKNSSEAGITVSVGFFDDILVPSGMLPIGTSWDREERVWVWEFDGNRLFIDVGEEIRFRVISETFEEAPPLPKDQIVMQQQKNSTAPTVTPYRITASIAEDGLGLLSWWK